MGDAKGGALPLTGVRVLEVGSYVAGPFCTMQLADLGADVIKVEPLDGGDQVRQIAPLIDGEGSAFVRLNRNKRSLVLDLKSTDGVGVFHRLADRADVIVENLRPGTMTRLGLGYQALAATNAGLIYVAISGWGQDGPLAPLAGLDIMAQARAGIMSITGEPDGGPVKVGVPLCDLVCGLYAALATLAALRKRDSTGSGQMIDVSLFEAGVSLAVWEAGKYFATGEVPARLGSAHQNSAPYQAIRCSDGWLTIGASTPSNWISFCAALGLQELAADARFADNNSRHRHRADLIEAIEAVTMTEGREHWIAILNQAGVPCAPIQDYAQVFSDPHLIARDYYWDAPHATLGTVRQLGSPMRLSLTPTRRQHAGPLLGEDSTPVLREAGYSDEEISSLLARAVVRDASEAGRRR